MYVAPTKALISFILQQNIFARRHVHIRYIGTLCVFSVEGVTCDVEIMCYGFDAAENTGYLDIDGVRVATWSSQTLTARRRKRQLTTTDGWHLFAISAGCQLSSSQTLTTDPTDGNSYFNGFQDFVQVTHLQLRLLQNLQNYINIIR